MKPRFLACLLLAGFPVFAQLSAPNAAGVSAGHDIFNFKDVEAATRFWTALGGEPAQLGPLKLTKFPGMLFYYPRPGNPTGGTEGSSIDYIGFKVRSLKDTLAKLDAAGGKSMAGATATQAFVMGPDDVKIRLTEDRSMTTPVAADMINMVVPDVAAAQAWYEKNFGAKLVKRGGETLADIPGESILFTQAKGPVAPTKGRAFDRIGLEVKNVDETCKAVGGSAVNRADKSRMDLAVCTLTDPWGTFIEVSQGLAAVK
jgi:catechol 2,3-dioxygenase-like lactoylglutathione lyase family enzyme